MKIISSGNNQLDVWECECGTFTPVKRGTPQPICEYCRRLKQDQEGSESYLNELYSGGESQ